MSEAQTAGQDVEQNAGDESFVVPPPNFAQKISYVLLWIFVRAFGFLYFRLTVRGGSNMPAKGPVLVVANHQSHLDPPMVGCAFLRPISYLAKADLWDNKIFGFLISWYGAFPIKRGGGDRAAIKSILHLLREGRAALIFPEGTRSPDGSLGEARAGVAMIINQMPEVTLLPVRIEGTINAFGPGMKFPRPRRIRVTVGKAFQLSDLKGLPSIKKQLYHEIGKEIMTRIQNATP